ncbi:MAG: hypothetical protein WBN42_11845 [Ignavibacteriaceae bacterium]
MSIILNGSGLVIFILFVLSEKSPAQTIQEKDVFPLTIPFIEIYDLDTTYKMTWMTRTIPPREGHKIDRYVYKLVITITLMDEEIWDKPFALLYELPGREKEFILVNEERYELLPEKFNQFIVEVLTKQKGWAKFELAIYDEISGGVFVPINSYPLRRRDFLLE